MKELRKLTMESKGKTSLLCFEESGDACDIKAGNDRCATNMPCPVEQDAIDQLYALESILLDSDGKPLLSMEKLKTAVKAAVPAKPLKESLADRLCPTCLAHIRWDALNESVSYAPACCVSCGQKFDWSDDDD